MTREAASNHDIAAFRRSIKQVTKLGEEMLKVTIHRENIPAGSSRESVRKSQANSVRRSPMQWLDSVIPRGQIMIDPETRDVVQTVYIRKVEKTGGGLYNVEFERLENQKDPGK